jgi:anaerobic dimethyl sulfoxide reductase subunit C (anchor subunit)
MQWKKISTATTRNIIAVLAALIGLALVFSMSQIYQLRTIPAWNTIATPITFFTTTFLLGTLAVGAAYVANYSYLRRKDADCAEVQCMLLHKTLRWLVIAAIVLLGIEFLVAPMYVAYLAALGGPAGTSAGMMINQFSLAFALRLVFVFLGAGILGLFIFQNAANEGREQVLGYLTYAAFALVLVGEVLGRFLFYATYARIGV